MSIYDIAKDGAGKLLAEGAKNYLTENLRVSPQICKQISEGDFAVFSYEAAEVPVLISDIMGDDGVANTVNSFKEVGLVDTVVDMHQLNTHVSNRWIKTLVAKGYTEAQAIGKATERLTDQIVRNMEANTFKVVGNSSNYISNSTTKAAGKVLGTATLAEFQGYVRELLTNCKKNEMPSDSLRIAAPAAVWAAIKTTIAAANQNANNFQILSLDDIASILAGEPCKGVEITAHADAFAGGKGLAIFNYETSWACVYDGIHNGPEPVVALYPDQGINRGPHLEVACDYKIVALSANKNGKQIRGALLTGCIA